MTNWLREIGWLLVGLVLGALTLLVWRGCQTPSPQALPTAEVRFDTVTVTQTVREVVPDAGLARLLAVVEAERDSALVRYAELLTQTVHVHDTLEVGLQVVWSDGQIDTTSVDAEVCVEYNSPLGKMAYSFGLGPVKVQVRDSLVYVETPVLGGILTPWEAFKLTIWAVVLGFCFGAMFG